MKGLYIGTCSWKYPSWEGVVYSSAKPADYLAEYARRYDSVEIDQWFWSLFPGSPPKLPRAGTVAEYMAATDQDFRFTVKAPNSVTLTHFYKHLTGGKLTVNPGFLDPALYGQFIDTLGAMQGRLGAVMLQFEYLNKQKMDSLSAFLERLDNFLASIPRHVPLAVEIRNPNYLKPDYFRFLKSRNIGHVFLQGYFMPSILDIYRDYGDQIPDWTVIRLHGGDREGIEERTGGVWNRIVDSRDEELPRIAEMIGEIQRRGILSYLNVNNHYEGSAPLTIERLLRYLR